MRLTKMIRQAFARAVLDDVPKVDYDEQIQQVIQDFCAAKLPKPIKAIYDSPTLRPWLASEYCYDEASGHHYHIIGLISPMPSSLKRKVAELNAAKSVQSAQRKELKSTLWGVLNSVNTREALVKALPEFEQYVVAPAPVPTPNLPALTNVVPLFEAAGWPKGKKGKS